MNREILPQRRPTGTQRRQCHGCPADVERQTWCPQACWGHCPLVRRTRSCGPGSHRNQKYRSASALAPWCSALMRLCPVQRDRKKNYFKKSCISHQRPKMWCFDCDELGKRRNNHQHQAPMHMCFILQSIVLVESKMTANVFVSEKNLENLAWCKNKQTHRRITQNVWSQF